MAFTRKDWKDSPDTSTPISAEALEDLETRLSGYTDQEVAAATVGAITDVPGLQAALDALQASATAATDAELSALSASVQAAIDGSATDAELAALSVELATKQAAATAATDVELADTLATVSSALTGKLAVSLLGQPNGVAPLDAGGLVPAGNLPSVESGSADQFTGELVGDVLEVALTSRWGIDADDASPYFDTEGATAGEDAWPSLDEAGAFTLTAMTGGLA